MIRYFFLTCCLGWYAFASSQPFKSLQQPFTSYTVNPDSCIMIQHTSGSLIFIESEGIVSDQSLVQLMYREFSSPLDMLVHGVRMHTQFGGDPFQLESTGMFEIYALDGEDTLAFDQEKRMQVRLNNDPKGKRGIEGYQYDEEKEYWKSYTNRVGNAAIREDDALWGSGPISGVESVEWVEDDSGFGFSSETFEPYQQVFQTMEIDDFGLYNYDRLIDGLEYVYLKPKFVTQMDQEINATVYVVYDDINSVFYFPSYTWDHSFFLVRGKSYQLFTIEQDGSIARLEEFPELKTIQNRSHTFTLQRQAEVPKDRNALAQLTGIQ